jgi:hypothetical protein
MGVVIGVVILWVTVSIWFHITVKAAAVVLVSAFVLTVIIIAVIRHAQEQLELSSDRARERARYRELMEKYRDEQTVSDIMAARVWQGMRREQVIDALGQPAATDDGLSRNKVIEVLKYGQGAVNQYRLRITLEDGLVTEWMQRG